MIGFLKRFAAIRLTAFIVELMRMAFHIIIDTDDFKLMNSMSLIYEFPNNAYFTPNDTSLICIKPS
jgi:hypothetical protein